MLRTLLFPFQLLYWSVSAVRNFLYNIGLIPSVKTDAIVIGIGNVNFGGTGKTEIAMHIASFYIAKGIDTAIVTRLYNPVVKAIDCAEQKLNGKVLLDEAALIKSRLPDARVIVAKRKWQGALYAQQQGAKVVIVDDALQHRRLKTDLMIGLWSGEDVFLREPINALNRCDVLIAAKVKDLEDAVKAVNKLRFRFPGKEAYAGFNYELLFPRGLEQYAEGIGAIASIANPNAFFHQLREKGIHLKKAFFFPDHFMFTEESTVRIVEQCIYLGISGLLCTSKDMPKLRMFIDVFKSHNIALIEVPVALNFFIGKGDMEKSLPMP